MSFCQLKSSKINRIPMRKIVLLILLTLNLKAMAQETRPGEMRFKIDTVSISKVKDEFVFPEFVITGRETVEVEVGDKIQSDELTLPEINLKFYETPHREKISSDVNLKSEKTILQSSSTAEIPFAKFKAGIGRYTTTYFDGIIQGEILKNLWINSCFYHRASQGFIENADYVKNQFSVGFDFKLPKFKGEILNLFGEAKLSSVLNYSTHSFAFYGADDLFRRYRDIHRSINNLNFNIAFESPYKRSYDYVLKINYSDFVFTLPDSILSFDQEERRFNFDFKLRRNIDFLKLKLNLFYTSIVQRYFEFGIFAGNIFEFFELGGPYELDFGLRFFSFENYDGARFRVYPNFSFKYLPNRKTQIYASFSPEVLNRTVSDYISENRFLIYFRTGDSLIKHLRVFRPENYFNLLSGVKYSSEMLGFDIGLGFKAFRNFPIYVDTSGLFMVEFVRVQFVELRSSGYFNYGRNEFIFDLTLRNSYNAKSKSQVPYYPTFSAVLGHSYKFGFGFAINSEISLIGNRVFNLEGKELPGFVLVNLGARYEVFQNFSIFVNFDNLFLQRFNIWNRYREPDMIFIGGVEYKF
jgi:outer membrane receptor protein involved in Fe transport